MSVGGWVSCGIVGALVAWIAYLTWAEYREHHPKPPKGNNIKGPLT